MPDEDTESPPGAGGCPEEAPLSTPRRCLAVSLPVWLVQRTAGPVPGARLPHYLMEFLIVHLCPVQLRRVRSMPARPRFSTSRQRPVPLFMMAPFWEDAGVREGETDRQGGRQQWRDRDRTRERRTTETETDRDRERWTSETERDRDRRTEREAERHRKIQRMRETERGEGDREIAMERQRQDRRDRETEIERDTQRDRERQTGKGGGEWVEKEIMTIVPGGTYIL